MRILPVLRAAKTAAAQLAVMENQQRDRILMTMAAALRRASQEILRANAKDMENARGRISDVMLDRLRLTEERIGAMAVGMEDVAALPSLLGQVEKEIHRPNGLAIQKVRVPMGVVAIIYESRPNVTADAAALCFKSGNVCILRGGSDAIYTNTAIVKVLQEALGAAGISKDVCQLIQDTTHASVHELTAARGYIDLLIPRGGKNLIRAVVEGAKGVPVIETGTGICHIYVDAEAELDMALAILYNAKTSRPSVCNAAEVCLVHADVAATFLPFVAAKLAEKGVQLRLDARAASIISGIAAEPDDFDTEFLDYILAVAVVDTAEAAIQHINLHSTGHSDAIVTQNNETAQAFLSKVDSAAVYHNASTRFTDGGEFGLGCEMGISTQKLGARGPMGLYELTSYKYIILGNGQTRE